MGKNTRVKKTNEDIQDMLKQIKWSHYMLRMPLGVTGNIAPAIS
jgi:hypothetical protein